MQLEGLMNILAPQTTAKTSAAAKGGNPAEGLLEALQGGFEGILAELQQTVEQTAEGLGEALAEVPEAVLEKIQELLGGMEDLAEGTPLAEFLGKNNIEPEVLGLSKADAKELVFDGDTFAGKGKLKSFDLPQALSKLEQKLESVTQMVKEGVENKGEALRALAEEFRSMRPADKMNARDLRRPSFFEGGDDFLKTREMTGATKAQAQVMTAGYAKQADKDASIFSKYAKETEAPMMTKSAQPVSEVSMESILIPEAVTATTKSSGESQVKAQVGQTLDLSQMGNAKPSEVITRIVNYLDQQQLTAKGELDVIVKHDELGQFRLNVAKGAEKGAIDMQISAGREGHRFFVDNEVELVKTLNQNGVRLTDLKIVQADIISEAGSSSKSNSFADSQSGEGRGQFNQSHQQRGGHSHDGSERRRQLWEEYRERMGASA